MSQTLLTPWWWLEVTCFNSLSQCEGWRLTLNARSRHLSQGANSTNSATCNEGYSTNHHKMASYDQNWYKHLPRFGYFVYNCHFPNKSVNHSKTLYVVPEDYKNDDNFLQHYCSLRLSRNTDTDYISAFPHFYYVIDLYEAIAYNQPHTDPTPFIQHSKNYQTSLQQFRPLQPIQPTVRNYQYIDVEIGSIHPCLVQCLP